MVRRLIAIVIVVSIGLAAEAKTQSVLPLKTYAEGVKPDIAAHVLELIKQRLKKYKRYKVMTTPDENPLDMILEAGFTDLNAESLAGIGKQWQADKVLYTEIKTHGSRHSLHIMLVDVKTKKSTVAEVRMRSLRHPEAAIITAVTEVFGHLPKPPPEIARVQIKTDPADAEVYLGGRYLGKSPISTEYKPGKYTIRIKKAGYKPISKQITLKKGGKYNLSFSLEKILLPKPPAPGQARPREQKKRQFYETWWFWTAVGVVVAGGITTAVVLGTKSWGSPRGDVYLLFNPSDAFKFDAAIQSQGGAGK